MGDHDELLVQLGEGLGHQRPVAQVEQCRGFVGHDHRRFDHQHRRQREQLLLAAGQQVAGVIGVVGETVPGEHLVDSSSSILLAQPRTAQREVHVLRHRGHDDLGVRIGEAEAHPPTDPGALATGVEAVHGDRAGGGDDEPVDHPGERGLPAAVDADDPDASFGEHQVDVREDGPVAVGVADAVEPDLGAAGVGHARVARCLRRGAIRPGRALWTCWATTAVTTALARSPGTNTPLAAIAAVRVSSVRISMPTTPKA